MEDNPTAKSKIVAILLAIFFSFFSWLYTYSRNSVKFWVALVINIALPIWFLSKIINDASTVYLTYLVIAWRVALYGIWIYAIVDNSVKRRTFYINYPLN
jgi:hypothetical protein